jgi:ribosomal protein S18 acetylase RimI-like enzyme
MIQYLDKEKYQGLTYRNFYVTSEVYQCIALSMGFSFKRIVLDTPIQKGYESELYKEYGYDSKAYGYFNEDTLIGLIQFHPEWNNRVRVFELYVEKEYRRKKIATKLMDFVKEYAMKEKKRGIILETQSCNVKAIDFYLNYGFVLGGIDTTSYSNNDIENHEVRLEMIYKL